MFSVCLFGILELEVFITFFFLFPFSAFSHCQRLGSASSFLEFAQELFGRSEWDALVRDSARLWQGSGASFLARSLDQRLVWVELRESKAFFG